jgi:hypothetical protein
MKGLNTLRSGSLWFSMVKKECVEGITDGKRGDSLILTITQRQFLTLLIGQHVENVYHPSGTSWSNRYSWHAAEFVRRQIETLAAELSEEAGEALIALASNKKLLSYRDRLRQAIANYAKIRQQHQYRQPDWDKTVETLNCMRMMHTLLALVFISFFGLGKTVADESLLLRKE